MENKEEIVKQKENSVIDNLTTILVKLLEAKNKENQNKKNKQIAIVDLMKLLNLTYTKIVSFKQENAKVIFNKYQDIWFKAITNANKKVKFPLLNINTNLWRVYLFTLFKSSGQNKLLEDLTGWSYKNFEKEHITEDMKIIILSIANLKK